MRDQKNRPVIFKLKDWPTSDDFKQILPSRFEDLMKNSPIAKYTNRESLLNLVSCLTDFFAKPDLGPKFYIAYSSIDDIKSNEQEGTTNLHVDISDAFNLMIYVGNSSHNSNLTKKHSKEKNFLLELINFEQGQYDRYLSGERPGALWHIFRPDDADKLREFLKTVLKLKIIQ